MWPRWRRVSRHHVDHVLPADDASDVGTCDRGRSFAVARAARLCRLRVGYEPVSTARSAVMVHRMSLKHTVFHRVNRPRHAGFELAGTYGIGDGRQAKITYDPQSGGWLKAN